MTDPISIVARIDAALDAAEAVLEGFTSGAVEASLKSGGDPVTDADVAIDQVLREALLRPGEGWLSEETVDEASRLDCSEAWVIDPLDGTREFVDGIPEWCVSVAWVVDGTPMAGGIMAPGPGHRIVGAQGLGITLNGHAAGVTGTESLAGALVLASRSEVRRGEWERFFSTPVSVRNMGSVAYKIGLVAAGLADVTWTLVPKHEWDVAGGAALLLAAGGEIRFPDGSTPRFNQPNPKLPGFIATNGRLMDEVLTLTSQ